MQTPSPGCSSSPAFSWLLLAVAAAHPSTQDDSHDSDKDEQENEFHHFDPVKNILSGAFSLSPSYPIPFFFSFSFLFS